MRSCIVCTLQYAYYYGDEMKGDEMGGTYITRGRDKNVYKILVVVPEGKKSLCITGHRWEN
jgi:hypothetical protein